MNRAETLRLITGTACIIAIATVVALMPWQRRSDCPIDNPKISVQMGDAKLQVEVAATNHARYCGLAFRDRLSAGTGMLFIYGRNQTLEFWMKDTRFPLALAFIDEHRRIIEIVQMTPGMDESVVTSSQNARFALETNPMWFAANGITIGDLLTFTLPDGLSIE